MRFALIALVTLTLLGCAEEAAQPLPTAPDRPPPAPSASAFVWVVVLEGNSGICIPGATVEIVRGQGLGRSLVQTTGPCSYWDPDDNAFFRGLTSGEELTLRASASGYAAKEIAVAPTSGPQTALLFALSRNQ